MHQAGCTDLKTQALPQQALGRSICNTQITGYHLTASAVATAVTSGRVQAAYKPRTCPTSTLENSSTARPHLPHFSDLTTSTRAQLDKQQACPLPGEVRSMPCPGLEFRRPAASWHT